MDVERLATAWYFGAGLCHKQGAIPGVSGCLVGFGPSQVPSYRFKNPDMPAGQVRGARCPVDRNRHVLFSSVLAGKLANPFFFLIHVVLAGLYGAIPWKVPSMYKWVCLVNLRPLASILQHLLPLVRKQAQLHEMCVPVPTSLSISDAYHPSNPGPVSVGLISIGPALSPSARLRFLFVPCSC